MSAYKDDIRALKDALIRLQDVSPVDGFIARGVADDGVSHYPFSSDDQLGPFLLGLWKYRESELCTDDERAGIDARIIRTVSAVKALGYCYPTELEGVTRCGCVGRDWRDVSQRIFLPYIAYRVGGGDKWKEDYLGALDEHPEGGVFSRRDILRFGYAPYRVRETNHTFWIFVSSHLMQYEVALLVNGETRAALREGLRHNGAIASEFTAYYKKADGLGELPFGDWRLQREHFDKAACDADPNGYACRCGRYFDPIVPGRRPEHIYLADSLFSAWIASMCHDGDMRAAAQKNLAGCIAGIDWARTRLSYAFAAECAAYAADYEEETISE